MGAKSTNITSQQMLPLFQVLSDLEKPYESSLSLGTSVSDIYLNKKTILDNDDFIIHHYSSGDLVQNRGISTRYCQTNDSPLVYGKYLDSGNTRHKYKSKNRRKYRRRLKIEHGAMDEIRFKFNGHSLPEKQRKNRPKNEKRTSRKNYSTKQNEGSKITDNINSSPDYDNKLLKKRIGLFTEMGLNAYNVKGDIDISRHFKNISREDLINSETDNPTTGVEQSDPVYEVPKNVRVKRTDASGSLENIGNVVSSTSKISRKEIIRKYEEMLAALMEKNQNNTLMVREKDSYINKIKSKLKELLSVNNQFADENEYMKKQHDEMKLCIEHYKSLVKSLEEHVEKRDQVIESYKGKCGQCNDKEVIAMKAERQCAQMSEDLLMLKNVVYRLNLQLSLYQDKIRHLKNSTVTKSKTTPIVPHLETIDNIENAHLPVIDEVDEISIPPIPNFDKTNEGDASDKRAKFVHQDTYSIEQDVGMVWGDVNSHTLGPLLNAYQESIVEKDQLVRDYECEFNRFTAKLKYIVEENDAMHEAITKMANELSGYKEKCGLAVTERDALRKECDGLKDKVDALSAKLNEVHSLYEQKVDTMTRDYTLIHEEYFQCKSNLASAQSKIQMLQEQCAGLKDQDVVPSNIHQTRIEECKRLFEDLKVRYDNDKERLNTKINLMQQSNELTERRIIDVTCEKQKLENKLKLSNHFVKKCRKEIHILKNELDMTKSARDAARKRAGQATAIYKQMAMEFSKGDHIQKIKNEKIRETFKELDALEKLLKEKDNAMEDMKEENEQEVSRLKEMLMENTASVQAMKKHINQERIKRYGSLQHINTTLPESFSNLKLSGGQNEGGLNLPSANIIPVRGGYFIHKDRNKPSS